MDAVLLNYLDWVHPWAYQVPLAYTYPISIAVIIAGIAYQAILTLDAFRIKNNIQLFAQCIANICLAIATTMQYGQLQHAASRVSSGHASYPDEPFTKDRPFWAQTQPLLIISIIAACSSTVGMAVLAIKLHREFSWALYKDISADLEIRGRYFAYQVYLVLIKLAFYFVFAFVVIYAFVNVHYTQPEFALTLAVIPLSLLTIAAAVYSTRKEARLGMALTIVSSLPPPPPNSPAPTNTTHRSSTSPPPPGSSRAWSSSAGPGSARPRCCGTSRSCSRASASASSSPPRARRCGACSTSTAASSPSCSARRSAKGPPSPRRRAPPSCWTGTTSRASITFRG
ncbi:hypothetical protein SLS55_003856 [Diplodia seriata]|uniref:Uncharacterized protein n=1 Tax=Diplodia seriata TaxID=420778 RepID=A0ABR3CQA5_9PEZI